MFFGMNHLCRQCNVFMAPKTPLHILVATELAECFERQLSKMGFIVLLKISWYVIKAVCTFALAIISSPLLKPSQYSPSSFPFMTSQHSTVLLNSGQLQLHGVAGASCEHVYSTCAISSFEIGFHIMEIPLTLFLSKILSSSLNVSLHKFPICRFNLLLFLADRS